MERHVSMATDSGQHIFGLQIVIAVDRQWTCGDGHASLPYLSVDPPETRDRDF